MTERKTELKPCPFCGGEGFMFEDERAKGFYVVFCTSCSAHGPLSNREYAIEAWNTRAALGSGECEFRPFKDEDWSEPNAVRGVCSECSALIYGKDNYCPNCGRKVVKR